MIIMVGMMATMTIPVMAADATPTPAPAVTATATQTPVPAATATPVPAAIASPTPAAALLATPTVSPDPTKENPRNNPKGNTDNKGKTVLNNQKDKKDAEALKNNNQKLQKLNDQLKKANDELASIETKIRAAIEKAIAERNKKAQNQGNGGVLTIEKLKAQLEKILADQKKELDSLIAEIADQTTNMSKNQADLQLRIANIDPNLLKDLAALDTRIAAATDQDTKTKLAALKVIIQKTAADQKVLLAKYLSDFNAFWVDKQKQLQDRLALLNRRQAIEKEFHTADITMRINELTQRNALIPAALSNTDAQLEKEVRDRFQKNIDAIKLRIKDLQKQIADLTKK